MCQKHNPITIYQDGGACVICAQCGRVLKPWRANGEAGNILPEFVLSAGFSTILALVVWLIFHFTAPDATWKPIGAAAVMWIVSMVAVLPAVVKMGKPPKLDGREDVE